MESANAQPPVAALSDARVPALQPCDACGGDIAISASACPRCGAENKFEHPRIAAFKSADFDTKPFNYQATGTRVEGSTRSKKDGVRAAIGVCFMLGAALLLFLPQIGIPLIGLGMLLGGVWVFTPGSVDTFSVDCGSGTPVWKSTNDEVFAPVKRFFAE